jgi:hypothetical protein
MNIIIGKRYIGTTDFVRGSINFRYTGHRLGDRIHDNPKKIAQIIIESGNWHKHKNELDKCIDRLCELGEFGEVTKICKFLLHQGDN